MSNKSKRAPTARSVAADVVVRVLRDKAYAAAALDADLERNVQLDVRDRALATEIAYGTLRLLGWLEKRVGRHAAWPRSGMPGRSKTSHWAGPATRASARCGAGRRLPIWRGHPAPAPAMSPRNCRTGALNVARRKCTRLSRVNAEFAGSSGGRQSHPGVPHRDR